MNAAMIDLRWMPDAGDGFLCLDGCTVVGRVRPVADGQPGARDWDWFARFYAKPNGGRERSRREAMLAVEDALERYLEQEPRARTMVPYPTRPDIIAAQRRQR